MLKPLEPSAWSGGSYWVVEGVEAKGSWRPLGPEENSSRYLASRGCYSTPGCGKAGERPGSTCAIDVEGHKRRPPSKVGGLCHEFRA